MFETIMWIFTIAVLLIVLIGATYTYLRNKSLQEIRADVYQLFLKSEHAFKYEGAGKQKMKWVVSRARGLLPDWLQVVITDEFLYEIFEMWFRAVKDLLDDGKYNKSVEEEE